MSKIFLGFPRENGEFGIRNWVLILPANREVNLVADKISQAVNGTKVVLTTGEGGRPKKDRETIARTLIGLALNPNTAAVLIIGLKKDAGYPELREEVLAEEIRKSGKPVRVINVHEEKGVYATIGEGIRIARELVAEASEARRVEVGLQYLGLGVKCGMSDPTSGIVGNPVIGRVLDILVGAGGTSFFSETTELIGAEHSVAQRAINPEVAKKILDAVDRTEKQAIATGEDIRSINPIPANIAAGITTLEEKSIGAIAKSGSMPIQDVLAYAQRPHGKGLYFIDAWMSSLSLPLGFSAAGAQLSIYQIGGGDLPEAYPTVPAVSSPIISPLMYITGNHNTYTKAIDSIDFDSSDVLTGKKSLDEAAELLLDKILAISSGSWAKMESWNHRDPIEILLDGPCL